MSGKIKAINPEIIVKGCADKPYYSCYVRSVDADGTLNSNNACDGYRGVRPLCYLSSEIYV